MDEPTRGSLVVPLKCLRCPPSERANIILYFKYQLITREKGREERELKLNWNTQVDDAVGSPEFSANIPAIHRSIVPLFVVVVVVVVGLVAAAWLA